MSRVEITGIDHVQLAIPPGATEEARAFYVGVLGLRERERPADLAPGGLWLAGAGLELHLGVEEDFRPAQRAHPGLLVRDLDAARAALEAAGHATRADERVPGVARFHAEDPFGNRLEFLARPTGC